MSEIRKLGDPILRKKCRPVRRVTARVRDLLDRMAQIMYDAPGVGLAAPQIGVGVCVVVIDIGDGLIQLINPEIVRAEGKVDGWEGCLSHPGWYGMVTRAERVTVRAIGRDSLPQWVEGDGLLARALQHELDHLDGAMFVDQASEIISEQELRARETCPLKVVAMGTPEFAIPTLEMLAEQHQLALVVTQPDRPRGRRRTIEPSPVKTWAAARGVQVACPERPVELLDMVRDLEPDVLITVSYGELLPASLLGVARLGAINVHASLLPRHRGASPIEHAILSGDDRTGVTTMWMTEGLDQGDIALQGSLEIGPRETGGELARRLSRLGADVLAETLELLAAGECPRAAQDHSQATYAPALRRKDELIDWDWSATEVDRRVRALAPTPGAFTKAPRGTVKIWDGYPCPQDVVTSPGVVEVVSDGLAVTCGEGRYVVTELQPAGGRRMSAVAYANGHPGLAGERWGGRP